MSNFKPTARLLLSLFRTFEQALLQQLENRGVTNVTPSHLNILRHLNNEGMKISQLAHDAALSKQLVGRIVKELEQKGYLQVLSDANDRRIKFVEYTPKGAALITAATEIVTAIEQRYETALGRDEYRHFRKQLALLTTLHSTQSDHDDR